MVRDFASDEGFKPFTLANSGVDLANPTEVRQSFMTANRGLDASDPNIFSNDGSIVMAALAPIENSLPSNSRRVVPQGGSRAYVDREMRDIYANRGSVRSNEIRDRLSPALTQAEQDVRRLEPQMASTTGVDNTMSRHRQAFSQADDRLRREFAALPEPTRRTNAEAFQRIFSYSRMFVEAQDPRRAMASSIYSNNMVADFARTVNQLNLPGGPALISAFNNYHSAFMQNKDKMQTRLDFFNAITDRQYVEHSVGTVYQALGLRETGAALLSGSQSKFDAAVRRYYPNGAPTALIRR